MPGIDTFAKRTAMVLLVGTVSAVFSDSRAQQVPPFVPEFPLACHPTEPVRDIPPEDPSAAPFGGGPWYVNDDRSVWASWQEMVPGEEGNRIMWIKPPGLELEITGRRLDGDALPLRVERNTTYLNRGFEPNRLYFETAGCWEVAAESGDNERLFVVEVKPLRAGR